MMVRKLDRSAELFAEASRYLAGGVSSDARRTSGVPLYVDHGAGAHLWDVDGNRYIDFVLGQGPAILGHSPDIVVDAVSAQAARGMVYSAQHELEVEVARLLCKLVPSADLVRFNTVGSEAAHAALRIARGATGRAKILKFEGHYHGWLDQVLFSVHPPIGSVGSIDHPATVAATAGQQLSSAGDLVVAPWNDRDRLAAILDQHRGEIAAIVMEPILCNSGVIMPAPGYLEAAQSLAAEHGALLIFDEVITGFRVAPGGAQEHLGVVPDLAVFGKAMAGGMQASAVVGRAEVMEHVASGRIAHAGTFNSHPVSMAASLATLSHLDTERVAVYDRLFALGETLMTGLRKVAADRGIRMLIDGPGPMFQTYFTDVTTVSNYREFAATDRAAMVRFQQLLLERGVNAVPRGLWFLSTAHTDDDIAQTIDAADDALAAM
jgi:glutamate-1-semialdehyde 2,1-aminomutase